MDLITCLNYNSGLITAIATVVLVIVTAIYTIINSKILKSNEKISNDNLRPYVIANIFSEDNLVKFEIKNIGKRPAKNVKISFNPSLAEIDKIFTSKGEKFSSHEPILEQEFLPPDFIVRTGLMYAPNYVINENYERVFKTQVIYYDLNDVRYEDAYTINLNSLVFQGKIVEHTNNYYFNQMKVNLHEMNESLKSIASIIKIRE